MVAAIASKTKRVVNALKTLRGRLLSDRQFPGQFPAAASDMEGFQRTTAGLEQNVFSNCLAFV
jgi:hypothetical protein